MSRFTISSALVAALIPVSGADVACAKSEAEPAKWPDQVTVTVGDIRTRLDGPKLWTLSGIDFRNEVMAVESSAYGTVFTIRDVGHLGTAHFLDVPGRPGEVEKEEVQSLKLFVDDAEVTEFAPEMNLSGRSFRMERTSRIRTVDLTSTVSIRDGVLFESAHLRARGDMDLQKAHPMMYAWSPEATAYVMGDAEGIRKRGVFTQEKATVVTDEKDPQWMAVFHSKTGSGSVCYLLERPPTTGVSFLIIDAPGVYRKMALMSFVDQILPAGYDGRFETAVGFFSASEENWEEVAQAKAAEIKSRWANRKEE